MSISFDDFPPVNPLYETHIEEVLIGKELIKLKVIKDLDQAIDLLCRELEGKYSTHPKAEDLCPYFGLLWPAGEVLGNFLSLLPDHRLKGKKTIELGCGLGLPSIIAAKKNARVLATDMHPAVKDYLHNNMSLNHCQLEYRRLNWTELSLQTELHHQFDLILGADVLYESRHPANLAQAMGLLLSPRGEIILTDPGRSYLQSFVEEMKLIGFSSKFEIENDSQGHGVFILNFFHP